MKSGNPVLRQDTFKNLEPARNLGPAAGRMTMAGTVNKTAMLLALTLITSMWTWGRYFETGNAAAIMAPMWIGLLGGLVVALVTVFKPGLARYTAPLYALLEGLAIGGISAVYETRFHGVVLQAVGLTFGTMLCMLAAYRSGLIKVTDKFRLGLIVATGGIALLYVVDMIMMAFGHPIGFIHEGGTVGILFSLVVVGIAALNLVLDFDFIARGVQHGAPKYMEWYGAFALLVTLIWLYLEILRLLGKTRR